MKFLGDPKLFPLAELKPHPAFQMLAAYSKKRETGITEVMRKIGFDPSEPLIVGIFGEERYVVGGYQRWGAAKASGREEIWIQEIEFESFDEAIAYEKTRYHLRRKGEDGDILFALCARQESLQQHGGKRRGEEADKIKLENPNLISGVTQAMYHSHKRLRHKDIAIQLGVPKHRVDHVRSKFFRHLSPEEIAGIRQNKTDAYELVDHWDPKRSGTPKKKNQAKSSETSEKNTASENHLSKKSVTDDAVAEELHAEPSALLEWIPLSPAYKEEIRQAAEAADMAVDELIAQWLAEKIETSAHCEPTEVIEPGSANEPEDGAPDQNGVPK